jgi:uncharacterized protein related to proFAR isomerase
MDLQTNKINESENVNTGGKSSETIPAINLFKSVPVIKGTEGYEPLEDKDGNKMDIHELIEELKERFDRVLITDINGINRDKPQLELCRDLSTKMKLWIDAGSRSRDGAIDVLVAGAERVVLGTKTLIDLGELEKALELSENVVLGIDYDDGIISPKKTIREMSPLSLVEEVKNLGIEEIIFTDLKHLSSDAYFSVEVGKALLKSDRKIYFHGRFDKGIGILEGMNLEGVMVEVETIL